MRTLTIALTSLCAACAVSAQSYQIDWYSINSGGGVSSGGEYVLSASIGQPVAGYAEGSGIKHWIGFWFPGEESGDPPTIVQSAAQAKMMPDGAFISIDGKIATSAASDFAGFFYLQESNRSSGLRITAPSQSFSSLQRGSTVNVIGYMATNSSGERELQASMIVIGPVTDLPIPLGMADKWVGGTAFIDPSTGIGQGGIRGASGLNNIGILIAVWGKVTKIGSGYVYIDGGSELRDGTYTSGQSNIGIRVICDTSGLGIGDRLVVTGISSCFKNGSSLERQILVRGSGDITKH